MKYLSIVFFSILVFLVSCSKENEDVELSLRSSNQGFNTESLDLKELHDEYSEMLCNLVGEWYQNEELNESKVEELWNIIVSQLAVTLNMTQQEVIDLFESIDINSSNYTNVAIEKYPLLSTSGQDFVDDIMQTYDQHFYASDEELINEFEALKPYWYTQLNQTSVDATIEIAKSSCVYWKNYFEDCISDNTVGPVARRDNKEGAKRLALGDVTGGLWGSFGGPAGALLGAVGGTLGAAISMAVFGW